MYVLIKLELKHPGDDFLSLDLVKARNINETSIALFKSWFIHKKFFLYKHPRESTVCAFCLNSSLGLILLSLLILRT